MRRKKKSSIAYTSFEWSRLARNNADPTTQLPLPDWNSEIFPLEMPVPKFDQVKISLFSYNDPLDYFVPAFGDPILNGSVWEFSNGIRLSKYNLYFYYTIIFKHDEEIFLEISRLLTYFPPHPSGKTAVQIKSTETAWDIPLPGKEYEEAEKIHNYLAKITIPKNPHASLYADTGDFQHKKDGIINGKITVYFTNVKKISNDVYEFLRTEKAKLVSSGQKTKDIQNFIKNSRSSWRGKVYLKHYAGMWHIRFEVTLSDKALRRRMNKEIDSDTLAYGYLLRVRLADFFEFGEFQWDDFVRAASKIAGWGKNRQRLKGKMRHRAPLSVGYGLVASTQCRLARRVARAIDSKRPPKRLAPKEFVRLIYPLGA